MTVFTSQNEIQTAMYAALMPSGTLDATLANLGLLAVYDLWNVPQNAPFDYITLGDGWEMPSDTFDSNGYKYTANVHLWSAQRGTQNPSLMVNRLDQLFHRTQLSLATLRNVYSMRQRATWMSDPAGTIPILHIVISYLSYSVQ